MSSKARLPCAIELSTPIQCFCYFTVYLSFSFSSWNCLITSSMRARVACLASSCFSSPWRLALRKVWSRSCERFGRSVASSRLLGALLLPSLLINYKQDPSMEESYDHKRRTPRPLTPNRGRDRGFARPRRRERIKRRGLLGAALRPQEQKWPYRL